MQSLNHLLTLHQSLFYLHIIAGSMALLLFWLPLLCKKGALNHRRFGQYYTGCMYTVIGSTFLLCILVLWDPVFYKGQHLASEDMHAAFSQRVRLFFGFLMYLGFLVYCGLNTSQMMLKHKQNHKALKTPLYIGTQLLLGIGGLVLLSVGIYFQQVLHMAFGVIGMMSAIQTLRYPLKQQVSPNQWLIEHFSAMIGTGIAAYTAFFTFGARRLLELGEWQLVVWFVPAIVGTIAITWLSRTHQVKIFTLQSGK